MDKKHVFYGTSDFMIQDAMNCLAAGFKFFIFGGEVFFVSKKFASIDRIDDTSTMTVVEDRLLARTGIFEKDLIGDKWAQQVKGGANENSLTNVSGFRSFNIGDVVYHRSVYEGNEPFKVVGITEDKLLLEGDFSGGTHAVLQRSWLPIEGSSKKKGGVQE